MAEFYTSVEQQGNYILHRGYNDNGRPIQERLLYEPTLYMPSNSDHAGEFKTLYGQLVEPVRPGNMWECREFVQKYDGVAGFQIYGNSMWTDAYIAERFDSDITFDTSILNITDIDIEVLSDEGFPTPDKAAYPVTAITVHNNQDDIFYAWGLDAYDPTKSIIEDITIEYVQCKDEAQLLVKFLNWWIENYPDIVTGWNSKLFDMTYLINRIATILGEDRAWMISPWGKQYKGKALPRRDVTFGQSVHMCYNILGIQQLDYMDLFKKFGYAYGTLESYKLDHVAFIVLGDRKLDYSEYGSLNSLYRENHQLFIDYNIKDTQLITRLEDKMGLIDLALTIAYKAKVNPSACFGPVAVWDSLIHHTLLTENIVVPPKKDNFRSSGIDGAYVKSPIPGMYSWVTSYDLDGLYPHIIMQYNMSPETIVQETTQGVTVDQLLDRMELDIPENRTMTATGQHFNIGFKGIMPRMVEQLYGERKVIKQAMLAYEQEKENCDTSDKKNVTRLEKAINRCDNQQQAIKILMNSLYGAMSNQYFRYFDIRIAESITVTGQLTIRWAEQAINEKMNKWLQTDGVDYVIAMDTDSLYLNFEPMLDKVEGLDRSNTQAVVDFIDNCSNTIFAPLLSGIYDDLKQYLNAAEQKMRMSREVIADKGIWTGKKHYILNVWDNEGVRYDTPKMKIKGIEAVRSSTPAVCREKIKQAFNIIINEDEAAIQKFVKDFRAEFYAMPVEDIAFPRTSNNMAKYSDFNKIYGPKTPVAVRGALLYNHYIAEMKLDTKYENIHSGDKVKFVYLKEPNKFRENVISFPRVLPKEFDGIEIDRELQFQKSFLQPLGSILDAISWAAVRRGSLKALISQRLENEDG